MDVNQLLLIIYYSRQIYLNFLYGSQKFIFTSDLLRMGIGKRNRMLMFTYGNWSHASSRIRAMEYIPMLENTSEWKVYHYLRAPKKEEGFLGAIRFALGKRLYALHRYLLILIYPWNLIFAQRIFLSRLMLLIVKWRKIPLVYDFDDAIYLGTGHIPTIRMIKNAQRIIVSSDELGGFCSQWGKNVVTIPSPVDFRRFEEKDSAQVGLKNTITIGWIGSPWTENYLNEVVGALRLVFKEKPYKLLLVGASASFKIDGVEVENVPWSYENEIDLLHSMDIGIMPLPNDEWSRGKGGYKLYQYMATGLPVIASPVGINKSIVEHGSTGFLAQTTGEWVKYLTMLGNDSDMRHEMGEAGRKKAENEYSYDACFKRLNQVLKATRK